MSTQPTRRLPREERREQLLATAARIFGQQGYHSASMDDIADAAGVSKPVLYQHFPSKHALYSALVESACERLFALVNEGLQSVEDNRGRVHAALRGFFAFVDESDWGFRFIFESDLTADEDIQARIWQVQLDTATAIGRVIAADTDLAEEEATLLGVALVGLAQTGARHLRSRLAAGESAVSPERALELAEELTWRGIGGFPKVTD